MYAVVRRYEGTDTSRHDEMFREVGEGFLPTLAESPGFIGYYFVDAGDGVAASRDLRDAAGRGGLDARGSRLHPRAEHAGHPSESS
jgi:hypothetical protein